MFVDKARITIQAGNGGNGAVSFHREKYVAAGGPDGGDGGRGGNVVFIADTNVNTLLNFKYKKNYKAQDGQPGRARNCTGKNAEDLVIRVPKGTVLREAGSGRVLADLSRAEPVVVAKGGKGGWGNTHFATSTRQIPRFAKPGLPGERFEIDMELKLLADVGLAGLPNVGKSTLVSMVSAARPEIANYPFTTLVPVLGVVRVDAEDSFVIADIPGLIEGASEGVGLGHAFLRHVDRCRMLIHMVDVSGSEGRDPIEDFEVINNELAKWDITMLDRPMLVAANKCDMASREQIDRFRGYVEKKGFRCFEISAATKAGVQELMDAAAALLKTLPPIMEYEPEPLSQEELLAQVEKEKFTVRVEDGIYFVEGDWLMRVLGMVDPNDYESMQYFQRVLRDSGIISRLEEMGIREGDTVSILNFEFEYLP